MQMIIQTNKTNNLTKVSKIVWKNRYFECFCNYYFYLFILFIIFTIIICLYIFSFYLNLIFFIYPLHIFKFNIFL
jgi:hypothetical protein